MNSIYSKSAFLKKAQPQIYGAVTCKKLKVKPKALRASHVPHIYSATHQNSFQLHHKADKIRAAVQPLEERHD